MVEELFVEELLEEVNRLIREILDEWERKAYETRDFGTGKVIYPQDRSVNAKEG